MVVLQVFFFLESTNEVQFLSEGTVWHQLARSSSVQFSSAEIWPLGTRCGAGPVWTSRRPVSNSLFLLLLLLLLPEALQQYPLVGRVEHSCLLQVLLGDVTEELQVIPAVV